MKVSKEELLGQFTSDRNLLGKIKGENARVVDYYSRKYGYSYNGDKAIIDLIQDNLYFLLEDENKELDKEDIKKWFNEINNFEICEFVDGLIDEYNDKLMGSYSYFQNYVENNELGEEVVDIMRRAQFDGYNCLFTDIKNEFAIFLENYIDEVGIEIINIPKNKLLDK